MSTTFKGDIPGNDWFNGLKRRHPDLVSRKPEATSAHRLKPVSAAVINSYTDSLKVAMVKIGSDPRCVWNMDETNVRMEHRPQQVYARKGSKTVRGRISNSRESVTLVACANGAGEYIPPMMLVKGKTHRAMDSWRQDEGPNDAVWRFQANAYMTEQLGEDWFRDVFLPNCGEKRPQLLILDGHKSHTSLGLLILAKDAGVELIAMPPHSTDKLQPLDRGVFKSLKAFYNEECSNFMSSSAMNVVNHKTWPHLIKSAFIQSMTPQNITSSFRVTGLCPFSSDVIDMCMGMPSDPTVLVPSESSSSTSTTPQLESNIITQPICNMQSDVIQSQASATETSQAAGVLSSLLSAPATTTSPLSSTIMEPVSTIPLDVAAIPSQTAFVHTCFSIPPESTAHGQTTAVEVIDEAGNVTVLDVIVEKFEDSDTLESMQASAILEEINSGYAAVEQLNDSERTLVLNEELDDIFHISSHSIMPDDKEVTIRLTEDTHIAKKQKEVDDKQNKEMEKLARKQQRDEKKKVKQELKSNREVVKKMKEGDKRIKEEQKNCSICQKANKKKGIITCAYCNDVMHTACLPAYVDRTGLSVSEVPFFCHKHMPAYFLNM